MLFQKQPKISELSVKETNHKDLVTRSSIELSANLWLKEEILPIKMELEDDLSMVRNLLIKILLKFMIDPSYFPWLMLAKIQMVLSSSLLLYHVLGQMANMLSLVKLLKDNKLFKIFKNQPPLKMENQKFQLEFQAQEFKIEIFKCF